jgi:hypothetical protein
MRFPQLIMHDADGWIVRQLSELAGESRWLLREPKTPAAVLQLHRDFRPTVLFLRVDPADDKHADIALLADIHRLNSDVAVVAVSDVKMPDADRIAWTAVLFDLGARYVLFPPLSKPILEDLASGLMTSTVKRVMGAVLSEKNPAEAPIDLADEDSD